MNIILSNTSSVPLYEQIVNGIKESIVKGDLKQGDALPSIRYLAKELQVSIITTKRAYEELETQGFIETVQGKGSFVTIKSDERVKEMVLSQMEEKIEKAIEIGKTIEMTKEDFIKIIHLLWEDSL